MHLQAGICDNTALLLSYEIHNGSFLVIQTTYILISLTTATDGPSGVPLTIVGDKRWTRAK